jgi:hypothetical protein
MNKPIVKFRTYFQPVLASETDKITNLVLAIKASTRADDRDEMLRRFVEPVAGTLREGMSAQHHVVFGRRGSGKTSLLRKAEQQLIKDGHAVGFIDLDVFKSQSAPNLIASVLKDAFTQFAAQATNLPRERGASVIRHLEEQAAALKRLVDAPDEADALRSIVTEKQTHLKGSAGVGFWSVLLAKVSGGSSKGETAENNLKYKLSKDTLITNQKGSYRDTLRLVQKAFHRPVFLMLDELYHLPLALQPMVLDYFHGIAKNNNVWLKIGTVEHRSQLMIRNEEGWKGMEMRQDAQPINLDTSFETFARTREFLLQVLHKFVAESGLEINNLATEKAIERLVQASGGVARDYLTLFVSAIDVAQARLAGDPDHKYKRISADDVWDAAAGFNVDRRKEFNSDVRLNQANILIDTIDCIRNFCFENALNCILVSHSLPSAQRDIIDEVWDCKLLHTVKTAVMVEGRHHTAYMLDVSEQASEKNRRNTILDLAEENVDVRLRDSRLIFSAWPHSLWTAAVRPANSSKNE